MSGKDLVAFLVKYVGGEKQCANDIARAFESSKLILHLAEDFNAEDTSNTTFKIFLQQQKEHQTALVFCAEEYFSRWCYEAKRPPIMIEVFGSDISAAIPAGTWLFLDPSSPHAMLLPPAFLAKVAAQDYQIDGPAYPIPKSDTGFLFSDFSSSGPGLYNPEASNEIVVVDNKRPPMPKPADNKGPAAPPFRTRSNPTEFFAVPQLAKKDEALKGPRPRSYTNSNLGKIIRPPTDKDKN